MNRLLVTEAERLCYSRRKLHAISALRLVDLDVSAFGLHKDYRVPGVKGRVYLVKLPDGSMTHFSRLADILTYANQEQQRRAAIAQIPSPRWQAWFQQQQVPAVQSEPPAHQPCTWKDGCSYDALPEQAYCAGHAFIARQIHAVTAGRE